jgi:hypothetical protein
MRSLRWFYILRLRLRSLVARGRVEDDLRAEFEDHLARREEELIARGLSVDDARAAARRTFGGVEQSKEACRDVRRVGLIEDAVRDVRYSARMLRRSPAFTVVAVCSLAVGIGANTALFGLFDALILRTLPVARPDALVLLEVDGMISHRQFLALRERVTASGDEFAGLAAVWTIDRANVTVESAPAPVRRARSASPASAWPPPTTSRRSASPPSSGERSRRPKTPAMARSS